MSFAEFETTRNIVRDGFDAPYITTCKCGWHCATVHYTVNIDEQPRILKHRLDHIEGKIK